MSEAVHSFAKSRSRETFLNFAYGSNLSLARLQARTPSARALGIASVASHALRWHKRSRDGSGKCDLEATAVETDAVWGVVYSIRRSEKALLDDAEGLGLGYEERQIEVVTSDGIVVAQVYFATDIDCTMKPYHWYKAFVVAGARAHGLPEDYIRGLEQVAAHRDPDRNRAARNTGILRGL